MASAAKAPSSNIPEADLKDFQEHLKSSDRILALLGAGLSASSGLPTFRGAGGLWRTHEATQLATPEAFQIDPGLVWQFYGYRRHMALKAKPNRAHLALAELAKRRPGFMTLSQNVDGLSQRAGHPLPQLQLLHGTLFDLRCTAFDCDYQERNNFTDPITPALADPTTKEALSSPFSKSHQELDVSDENVDLPAVAIKDLPHCPRCKTGLLRPGVVWFGESLPAKVLDTVNDFIAQSEKIDLILVIGTSARVHPAAGYISTARWKGARVAVVNTDEMDARRGGLDPGRDWFFRGDAGVIVPELLKAVTGDVPKDGETD